MAASEELARRVVGGRAVVLAHHRRPGGVVEARHPEAGGVPGGLPRGGEVQPRGLEARDAAQALRAADAQDLRRLRLVGRVVAGGHGARVAARARLRRAQGGPRAHGRRRHRQDAHGVGPLRAGVREEARGALLHGVLARDAPEARPRRREARPGGRAHRKARLLVIDELGFLPLDADGARLLFQVLADAYERQSVVFTTNLEFSRCGRCSGTTRWPPP